MIVPQQEVQEKNVKKAVAKARLEKLAQARRKAEAKHQQQENRRVAEEKRKKAEQARLLAAKQKAEAEHQANRRTSFKVISSKGVLKSN